MESLRAAKYDLRLSGSHLILPDGRIVSNQLSEPVKPFVLEPGQTALISTMEQLVIPLNLAGIIGPRLGTSETGLYIFGGMLVDPGFGYDWSDEEDKWLPEGRPLIFHVANLGQKPIPMVPEVQRIASISFITVDSPYEWADFPRELQTTSADVLITDIDNKRDTRSEAIGFLTELEELNTRLDKLEVGALQLNLFGTIVVLATLIGAIVSVLFGLGAKSGPPEVDFSWGSAAVVVCLILAAVLVLSISAHLISKTLVSWRALRRRR